MNSEAAKFYIALDKLISEIGPVTAVGMDYVLYEFDNKNDPTYEDRAEASRSIFNIKTLNVSGESGDSNKLTIHGYIPLLSAVRGLYEYSVNHNLKNKIEEKDLERIFKIEGLATTYFDSMMRLTN